MRADGFSLDGKCNPVGANDLPDVRARWAERARTEQSFCLPKARIVEQGYLSPSIATSEIVYDEMGHRGPFDVIADIEKLNAEIVDGIAESQATLE